MEPKHADARASDPIRCAVVLASDGTVYRGTTHGEAFERATAAGLAFEDLASVDMFETAAGRLIDRFDATFEFDVCSSEGAAAVGMIL